LNSFKINIPFGLDDFYEGPGDIVSGAFGWWGLRAYNFATIGNSCIRLRRSSDNAEQDFVTLSPSGALDVASISSFKGAANLFVSKTYDQTGNGRDLAQSTAANQPTFTLSGLGSLPIMSGSLGSSTELTGNGIWTLTQAQPMTYSHISRTTGNFTS